MSTANSNETPETPGRTAPACCVPSSGRHPAASLRTEPTPATAPQRPARLVALPGGRFPLGTDQPLLPQDGEGPARPVAVAPFAIDPLAVTNAAFAAFCERTAYRTEAERDGWSLVFHRFVRPDAPALASPDGPSWWRRVEGACWHAPEGPGSSVAARPDHPVTHVSWADATAFAAWAGGRLPTEAEWEFAASGGRGGMRYPWGDREPDDDRFQPCNIWQGRFPDDDTGRDGYRGTAPAGSFEPNAVGLHNMVGNTWEWCADRFRVRSLSAAARRTNRAALSGTVRLLKGGSYLCHRSYCHRYRIAARTGAAADSSTGHVGFRLVYDPA